MDSEKLTDDQLVKILVKTIKQVLATRPQLLYRAFRQCAGDYFFERMKAEIEGKPNKAQNILMRNAICLMAQKVLINSDQASMDDEDKQNIAAYVNFMAKEN